MYMYMYMCMCMCMCMCMYMYMHMHMHMYMFWEVGGPRPLLNSPMPAQLGGDLQTLVPDHAFRQL